MPMSPEDRDMLIRTTIGEAEDQPEDGRAAVAHVIMNRVKTGRWGKTPSEVVLARGQFEPWQKRARELIAIDPQSPRYQRMASTVDDVLSGKTPDPTSGATHFLDESIVRKRRGGKLPDWATGDGQTIGSHTFYAPEGRAGIDAINKAIGAKSADKSVSALPFADDSEDLLGSLVKPQQSDAVAAPLTSVPTKIRVQGSAPKDDLLGSLVREDPQSVPASSQARPTAPVVQDHELSQLANRLVAEHQGDTWGDSGVRLGAGVLRGVGDVADTLAQGIGYTGEKGANALSSAGAISPESQAAVRDWRSGVNARVAQGQQGFTDAGGDNGLAAAGRVGGQIVGSAPFLAGAGGLAAAPVNALTRAAPGIAQAIAQPAGLVRAAKAILPAAGVGAGTAALTSATSDAPVVDQALQGGVIGGVLGPIGAGAAKLGRSLMGGIVEKPTAALAKAARDKFGIKVGAGQISENPTVRFLDSVMQRLPFTGMASRTAAQQNALNGAIAREMGVSAEKITPDVVRQAKRAAYVDYDAAKATMGPLKVDHQFYNDLVNINTNAHYNLEPGLADRIKDHLSNVFGKIDQTSHTLDPNLFQTLTRKNGPLDKAINQKDSKISDTAKEIKEALEDLVGRNNPALKELYDKARYKYFVASSVEHLADDAPTGNISPAKLLKAVDHSETAVGELGRIAKRFMVEPPSSGTSEREMIMRHITPATTGLLGAGALGAANAFDPESWQRNALIAASTIGLGRLGTKVLRGDLPANAMIRSGLRGNVPSQSTELVNRLLPAYGALSARRNALAQSP